jgi:hypothetical protein
VGATETRLEIEEEAGSGPRWRITAIEEAVDDDVVHAQLARQLGQRDQVPVVGVDTAGADEADERKPTVGGSRRPAGVDQDRVRSEGAVGDGGIDARQVLEHRPTRTEVQVPDLRVAHLAIRQADVAT